jgi:hypothetical protein
LKRIFKPLLDPGGRFASDSETAVRRFQKRNGRHVAVAVSEAKRLQIYDGHVQRPFPNCWGKRPFGCDGHGHARAVAVCQGQRLCSGFWCHNVCLASPRPHKHKHEVCWKGVDLRSMSLAQRNARFAYSDSALPWVQLGTWDPPCCFCSHRRKKNSPWHWRVARAPCGCAVASPIKPNRAKKPQAPRSFRRATNPELRLSPLANVRWPQGRVFWPEGAILVRCRSLVGVTIPIQQRARSGRCKAKHRRFTLFC